LSKRFNTGFTLVELLVVVGIIGFLLAILVPVLGRAKDQSRLIVCRSNQRSLLMGCLTYACDNNSCLPVDKQLHNEHTILIKKLSQAQYIEEPKAYYCPSEKDEDIKYSEANFSDGNIGYFYYSFEDRPTLGYLSSFFLKKLPWPRRLKDTSKSSKWVFSDSWFSGAPTAHRWYKKGVNYVTVDGSMCMVKKSPKREFD
jgi:prepilin-type N-terminal cleavage/methylation domain-containing protein